MLVEVAQALDHRLRFLRGGRVVEPHQRLAIDALGEDREIPTHRLHIEAALRLGLPTWLGGLLQARRRIVLEKVEVTAALPTLRCRRRCRRAADDRLHDRPQLIASRQAIRLGVHAIFPGASRLAIHLRCRSAGGAGCEAVVHVVVRRSGRCPAARWRQGGRTGIHLRDRRGVGLGRAEVQTIQGAGWRCCRQWRLMGGQGRCGRRRCRNRKALRAFTRQAGEQLVGQLRERADIRQSGRRPGARQALRVTCLRITCKCLDSHGTCRPPRHRALPGRLQSVPPASSTARSGRRQWHCG